MPTVPADQCPSYECTSLLQAWSHAQPPSMMDTGHCSHRTWAEQCCADGRHFAGIQEEVLLRAQGLGLPEQDDTRGTMPEPLVSARGSMPGCAPRNRPCSTRRPPINKFLHVDYVPVLQNITSSLSTLFSTTSIRLCSVLSTQQG